MPGQVTVCNRLVRVAHPDQNLSRGETILRQGGCGAIPTDPRTGYCHESCRARGTRELNWRVLAWPTVRSPHSEPRIVTRIVMRYGCG